MRKLKSNPSTPLCGGSTGAGRYPDILVPAEGEVTTAEQAFFDVAIAPDAPGGRHVGRLLVGGRDYPVVLTVEPFAIVAPVPVAPMI